jgi:hypothetical protein
MNPIGICNVTKKPLQVIDDPFVDINLSVSIRLPTDLVVDI